MKTTIKLALSLLALLPIAAFAQEFAEVVHAGGFPTAISPTATVVTDAYNFVFWITACIAVLVEGVILVCIWKFRRSKNPVAAKFTHNTLLEIVWISVPAIICVAIAVKSFDAMQMLRSQPEKGLTVEAIAYQFGWDFEYPDQEMVAPEAEGPHPDLSIPERERYVKEMVVPINTNVKVQVVAKDVLHAYYVPALGVKIDAVPGRINYAWFNAMKTGEYIGQCAELCGSAHGEMYFSVRVVTKPEYLVWVNTQRAEKDLAPLTMAQLEEQMS